MFKKLTLVALGVVAALMILSYTKFGSYTSQAWGKLKATAKKQVPIDMEIQRLKDEVTRLDTVDAKRNRTTVAEEIVALRKLRKDIDEARASVEKKKNEMREAHAKVKAKEAFITYNGQDLPATRVQDLLVEDVQACKNVEDALNHKEKLYTARKSACDAGERQLLSMKQQKERLELRIAELEAKLKLVQLAQTESKFQFDDSRLADIKKSVDEIDTQIQVMHTELELAGKMSAEPQAKPTAEANRKVDDYLGTPAETKLANGK
jgi:hypothetical protein